MTPDMPTVSSTLQTSIGQSGWRRRKDRMEYRDIRDMTRMALETGMQFGTGEGTLAGYGQKPERQLDEDAV